MKQKDSVIVGDQRISTIGDIIRRLDDTRRRPEVATFIIGGPVNGAAGRSLESL